MDKPTEREERIEISVDEAMTIVVEFMKSGRYREANALCEALLELEPDNADALHYAGILAHRRGQNDRALELIERSLALVPGQADWYSNLGIVLRANGQFEAAIEAFRRAIALDPAHQNAHNNLGVLLRAFGRLEEAEAEFRAVIALNRDHPDVYFNLAVVLDQTGRANDALTAYCKALTMRPSDPQAHRHLALAYSVIGETQKAIEVCEEWVRNSPDDPRARHALAAHSGRDVPPRASDEYVETVFDNFASDFEAKLARLDYRAPALVAEALAAVVPAPDRTLDIADVGCGTGLCGPLLTSYARRLVGVDLSKGMLEHAREKKVYDDLVHAELTAFLQAQQQAFDVIVSADTLVYFGELEEMIAAAAQALRPGGILVFTVEEATDAATLDSFSLEPSGRYVHGARYVERLLVAHGLDPAVERGELRMESGLPVQGLIVRAIRSAPARAGIDRDAASHIGERHA